MKRLELLKALTAVKPGIASKDVIESMTYFFFTEKNVVSYNDRISIQYPINTGFNAFVKADEIYKVLSKLKSDTVDFTMDKNTLKMKSGKSLTAFVTIHDKQVIDRISTVEESMQEVKFKNLPDNFIESVKLCAQVASKNESDQTLTCIYISDTNMIATDNKRIAHAVLSSKMDTMLLRASEMKSLMDINPIKYGISGSWIHFQGESSCVFSIRTTKGEFPDMLKFMEFDGTSIMFPKEILNGVDLASIFTNDSDDYINVKIANKVCTLDKKAESGRTMFKEFIEYDGDPISFNIHPEILKDMLAHNTDIVIAEGRAKLHSDNFTLVTSLPVGE